MSNEPIRKLIHEVGEIDYTDVPSIKAPVLINEDFCKKLAEYQLIRLTKAHNNDEVIGRVTNLSYNDGKVFGDVFTDFDEYGTDFELSTDLDFNLTEQDGVLVATDPQVPFIGLVDKTRSYNINNESNEHGDTMADDYKDKYLDLKAELIVLKQENERLKADIKGYEAQADEKTKLEAKIEEQKGLIKELEIGNTKYNEYIDTQKPKLIRDILGIKADEDIPAEKLNVYKDLSLEVLSTLVEDRIRHQNVDKGVQSSGINKTGQNSPKGETDDAVNQVLTSAGFKPI